VHDQETSVMVLKAVDGTLLGEESRAKQVLRGCSSREVCPRL
jgi:hypothetical protein